MSNAVSIGLSMIGGGMLGNMMTSLVKPPMIMEMPQAPGSVANPDAQKAGAQQRKRTAGAQGRSDTIKTGPGGLGEVSPQNTEAKSLLGY
jgi:hypothetical protein